VSFARYKSNAGRDLRAVLFVLFLLAGVACVEALAQNQPAAPPSNSAPAAPAPFQDLSKGPEVSLSADKLNELLRKEPGLLLQVKRVLIRKAAEQGRILYDQELTDDAVFHLVEQYAVIRAVVTDEAASRGYIQLRPTEQESEAAAQKQRQKDLEYQQAQWELQYPAYARGAQQPGYVSPGNAQQRALNGAGAYTGDTGMTGGVPIRPDELPGLLDGTLPRSRAGAVSRAGLLEGGRAQGLQQQQPGGTLSTDAWNARALSPYSAQAQQPGLSQLQGTQRTEMASIPREVMRPRLPAAAPPDQTTHLANPYADVPALYDLYVRMGTPQRKLQRFGMDVFVNGTGNFDELPMDVPVGPDYVVGPGDSLKIELWGSVSGPLVRVVDREGRVALPEVGAVDVNGHTLGDVQREVQAALRTQFRDVKADVSLSRLRSVRVYVVGDVQYPGAYEVSSLSSPLNAVYAAGGPTDGGSMRLVHHYRAGRLVEDVDLYDLLLHGVSSKVQLIQSGDTIQVPPVGPTVTVDGMVRRPAIYEMKGDMNLAEVLELAGGVLPTGALRHIDVDRLQAHENRTMLRVDLPTSADRAEITKTLAAFKVQDGDRIRIAPILPYSEKAVYLDGHVYRPGKYTYQDGMKITDLIKNYNDLLPEPSEQHAEVIRLQAPDYRPTVLGFNLASAMAGKEDDLKLQPFDTVRIFGRYDFQDPPEITVGGEVRNPGPHRTNGETHLRDAIYLAGGLTPNALLDDAQVFRRQPGGTVQVLDVNLAKALAGNTADNLLLEPLDRVIVHRNLTKVDPATVTIQGEVASPGKYPLGQGMTAAELVRAAGGLKRSAYTNAADLSRYVVQNGQKILGEHQEVPLAKALSGDGEANLALRDGDVLTIRQLSGWHDIGAAITVEGEVAHPGVYGIHEGERLSSILERAGGFRSTAYPYGAVLERVQVKDLAEKSRGEMIRRLEAGSSMQGVKLGFSSSPAEQAAIVQAAAQQQQQVLASLKSQPASGRLVIHISPDVNRWRNTNADIEVRAGDVITIPKRPNFILISGQVYNASAITYTPGKSAGWYLRQAGGTTSLANKKAIYIIRADGSVVADGGGWWRGNALGTRMEPGDTIVVPERILSASPLLRDLMSTAQIASSLAIAARVATSF
jgi:polysaccharide export outer membrane protein